MPRHDLPQRPQDRPWHRQLAHVRYVTLAAKFLIPKMFAQVSQGNMNAQDAVGAADHDMKVIYKKWRDAGKI